MHREILREIVRLSERFMKLVHLKTGRRRWRWATLGRSPDETRPRSRASPATMPVRCRSQRVCRSAAIRRPSNRSAVAARVLTAWPCRRAIAASALPALNRPSHPQHPGAGHGHASLSGHFACPENPSRASTARRRGPPPRVQVHDVPPAKSMSFLSASHLAQPVGDRT